MKIKNYLILVRDKNSINRALRVSLMAGLILNFINHTTLFTKFSLEGINLNKVVLIFIVPFGVSLYSSVLTNIKSLKGDTFSEQQMCKQNQDKTKFN